MTGLSALCLGSWLGLLGCRCVLSEGGVSQQRIHRDAKIVILPESVLESPRYLLQVSHSASPGGLSALSLLPPFKRPQFGSRISTLGAG